MTGNMKRGTNPRSLSNLNPKARLLGKVKLNLTVKPETIAWLKKGGNASAKLDYLVDAIRNKQLVWVKDLQRD
jgi:hypothetical protein